VLAPSYLGPAWVLANGLSPSPPCITRGGPKPVVLRCRVQRGARRLAGRRRRKAARRQAQGCAAPQALENQAVAATVLVDVASFVDEIDVCRMAVEPFAQRIPPWILALVIEQYLAPRRIRSARCVRRAITPRRSIMARCTVAYTVARVTLYEVLHL
jgi:hypothetical protein